MKKNILFYLIYVIIITYSYGQRSEWNPKHENHYQIIPIINTNEVSIEISDAHSQMEFTKMKLKITNKTGSYIIFKPSECVFRYTFGDYNPTSKDIIIEPHGIADKVLSVKGGNSFHVPALTVELNGFYKLYIFGSVLLMSDFRLSASNNNFAMNGYSCNVTKLKKQAREISVNFNCSYNNGSKVGIIDPNELVLKLSTGHEFANSIIDSKEYVMTADKTDDFSAVFKIPGKIIDVQSVIMYIAWKNTFSESIPKAINITKPIRFQLDPDLTMMRNR